MKLETWKLIGFGVLVLAMLAALAWTSRVPKDSAPFLRRDFLFMPLYTAVLVWGCVWARSVLATTAWPWLATVGFVAIAAALVVLGLDIVENVAKLRSIAHNNDPALWNLGVRVKWVLWRVIAIPSVYILAGIAVLAVRMVKSWL